MQERIVLVLGAMLVMFACANAADQKALPAAAPSPVATCNCHGDAGACDCDNCKCPACKTANDSCPYCDDCASCESCGSCCEEQQFRTPIRTFFHNRQPVRRLLRFAFRR